MTRAKEQDTGMIHGQGGEPVPEEVAEQSIKELERRLEEQADLEEEQGDDEQEANEMLLRMMEERKDLHEIGERQKRRMQAEWKSALARANEDLPPEPEAVQERVFTGSYGVMQTPHYHYQWEWQRKRGGATATPDADPASGVISARTEADDGNGSKSWSAAGVAGFFRPNVPNGYMTVTVTPSYKFWGGAWSALAKGRMRARIQLLVGKYRASTGALDRWIIDQQRTIAYEKRGGPAEKESGTLTMNASSFVDSAHYYIPWLIVRSYSSNSGQGVFHHSSAYSHMVATLPWMRLAIY